METRTFCLTSSGPGPEAVPAMNSDKTLVLAFGNRSAAACEPLLATLATAYPDAHILGCSTAGQIVGKTIVDDGMAVAVCRFSDTSLRTVTVPIGSAAESCAAGKHIASELAAPDLRGVFLVSDGTLVNGSELVSGVNSVLPAGTTVTGGLAGDGDQFQRTWIASNGKAKPGLISAVGLYGEHVAWGHGSKGGWDVFGPERVVTRSEGNVLYEIDGRSALGLYKLYLGELASGLPANALLFPLSLRKRRDDETKLVRTILSIDEKTESMTFAGDVPQGSLVKFMRANYDRLIDGAGEAGRLANRHEAPVLGVAVSCIGRRLVLGDRADEEVEAAYDALPPQSQLIGFYSYGELAPYGHGPCELHNQTMTVTTLCER